MENEQNTTKANEMVLYKKMTISEFKATEYFNPIPRGIFSTISNNFNTRNETVEIFVPKNELIAYEKIIEECNKVLITLSTDFDDNFRIGIMRKHRI